MLQLVIGTRHGVRMEYVPVGGSSPAEAGLDFALLELTRGFQGDTVRVRAWNAAACSAERVSLARFSMPLDAAGWAYDGDLSSSSSSDDDGPTTTTTTRMTGLGGSKRVRAVGRAEADDETTNSRRLLMLRLMSSTPTPTPTPTTTPDEPESSQQHKKKKRRRSDATPTTRMRVELELTDSNPEDIGYIWVVPHTQHLSPELSPRLRHRGAMLLRNQLPHPPQAFQIENTCGAFHTDEPLAQQLCFANTRRRRPAIAHGGDLITMLSGTLVPCLNRCQVDFRGVRSLAALREDWGLLTQTPATTTTTKITAYMMMLTACTGAHALVVDYGMRPPPTTTAGMSEASARVAADGHGKCYLAERMAPWYTQFAQHVDVCQAVELRDLKWPALLRETPIHDDDPEMPIAPPLLVARSNAHISRRGGVMLRLVFPKDTPWDERVEHAVLRDCNRALLVLRRALQGAFF